MIASPAMAPLGDLQMMGKDGEEPAGEWGEEHALKGDKVMKLSVTARRGASI